MGVTVREKDKGSNVWWVFINHQGRRKSKRVGSKKAAKEVAVKIEAKLADKSFKLETKDIPLFGKLAQDWRNKTVPATCKSSTAKDYQRILKKHVGPAFNSKPVDQITKLDLKDFLHAKINQGYAPSTVTHMKNVVSGVLGRAVEAGLLEHNPAHGLKGLYREKPRGKDIAAFTLEELNALLGAFQQKWPREYPLVLTLARTGLRAGEALGLKWDDLDFINRTIHVRRSLSHMELVTPKSGKSRPVDMSPQLSQALNDLQTARKREALAKWGGEVPDLVFVNQKGKPVDLNPWRRWYWKPTLKRAEVPPHRIHDLRHTYATLRIQAGHNIADVSKQLGHHSVKFTLDQYFHWLPGGSKSEVDQLDNLQLSAPQPHLDKEKGASHKG